ncbi:hypothetical protein AB0F17_53815 [Nonomuraea sp. NPDC026600]|uniref:hypothetical protein n=1 Tax=Nonomuraea sp. NPDC026600 TaxID=3155363 RepID=UPI0033C8FA91
MILAWKRGTWLDGVLPAATFMHAVPYFWVALALVFVFGVTLQWFPVSRAYGLDVMPGLTGEFAQSVLYHAALRRSRSCWPPWPTGSSACATSW